VREEVLAPAAATDHSPDRMISMTSAFGVVFDMDGVLIDSARPHFQSWQQLALEQGRTVTDTDFAATFGRQNKDIVPILFNVRGVAQVSALADRKEVIYRDLIRERPPIVLGAVELVKALHAAGVRLAVGSSAPLANIELVLHALGVSKLIRAVVSGDDVVRGKPDPQVFTEACRRLDLPPERCVVIEDAAAGIQAACAAGARTVAVSIYHPATTFDGADIIVPRLSDLSVETLSSLVRGDRRICG